MGDDPGACQSREALRVAIGTTFIPALRSCKIPKAPTKVRIEVGSWCRWQSTDQVTQPSAYAIWPAASLSFVRSFAPIFGEETASSRRFASGKAPNQRNYQPILATLEPGNRTRTGKLSRYGNLRASKGDGQRYPTVDRGCSPLISPYCWLIRSCTLSPRSFWSVPTCCLPFTCEGPHQALHGRFPYCSRGRSSGIIIHLIGIVLYPASNRPA